MSESAAAAPVKKEVKKEEAPAPAPEGGAPAAAPAGGRGPRRGPKGEKTCYNCGEVRRFDCSCHLFGSLSWVIY
jgi:hypothetical protein